MTVPFFKKVLLFNGLMLSASISAQVQQPYTTGRAYFVNQPYNSSVYTEYNYQADKGLSNRLPSYTSNQAVFVQQPYGNAQQLVNPYPTTGSYGLPYTESHYASPSSFPSTTVPAYPFATVRSYTSSPYPTTVQYPASGYPYGSTVYQTETYPYVSRRQTTVAPQPTIQTNTATGATTVYPAQYPTSTYQTPYPFTTAVPETAVQPGATVVPSNTMNNTGYYYPDPNYYKR